MRGPQVVIASRPPGFTIRQSSATCDSMSDTKKIPNTHTTASKWRSGYGRSVMSALMNSMFVSPRAAAFALPSASS